jgi:hypothetical protein
MIRESCKKIGYQDQIYTFEDLKPFLQRLTGLVFVQVCGFPTLLGSGLYQDCPHDNRQQTLDGQSCAC